MTCNHECRPNLPNPPLVRGFVSGRMTKENVHAMLSFGANVVRLQVHPFAAQEASHSLTHTVWAEWEQTLDRTEREVRLAAEAGLSVVVDLHRPPIPGVDVNSSQLWQHPDLEQSFCRVWRDLVLRLQPLTDHILGYDLFNEPLDWAQFPNPPREWYPLALKLVQTIRSLDDSTWIVYESGPGGLWSGLRDLQPVPDDRVIYSIHCYVPHEFTHQGIHTTANTDLKRAMWRRGIRYPGMAEGSHWDRERLEAELIPVDTFQRRWGVPVYVGEFSVVRWAPEPDSVQWLSDVLEIFESRGWSWTYHAFREFHGWSLEHDGAYWEPGDPEPLPSKELTGRAALVRTTMQRNLPW